MVIETGERRTFERRPSRRLLEFRSLLDPGRRFRGETRNLTPSGMYLVTEDGAAFVTLGTCVSVRLLSGSGEPSDRELRGTVMRVEALSEEGREIRGIALRFSGRCPEFE